MGLGAKTKTKLCCLNCTVCGTEFCIQRRIAVLKEKNHIKDLYCYKCKKVTKFIENKEREGK